MSEIDVDGPGEAERVSRRSAGTLEDLERRIDRTEAQLEGLRAIRASVLFKAVPFMALALAAVFGMVGWGAGDPLAVLLAVVLIGGLLLFGVGAQFGIRRGEARLDEIEAEYAETVRARSTSSLGDGGGRP